MTSLIVADESEKCLTCRAAACLHLSVWTTKFLRSFMLGWRKGGQSNTLGTTRFLMEKCYSKDSQSYYINLSRLAKLQSSSSPWFGGWTVRRQQRALFPRGRQLAGRHMGFRAPLTFKYRPGFLRLLSTIAKLWLLSFGIV